MMMTLQDELRAEVEAFLKRHDMAPTRFGELAVRDYNVVARMRKGYGITMRRAEQLRQFMRQYQGDPPAADGKKIAHHAVAAE